MHSIPESLIRSIVGNDVLTAPQIRSILRTAYLAAEIDFESDVAERALLDDVASRLWQVAGLRPEPIVPVSPLPLDDEERRAHVRVLAAGLTTRGARELAYTLAYLLSAADIAFDRAEMRLLDDLQRALALEDTRAADLAAMAAEAVTPGVEGEATT